MGEELNTVSDSTPESTECRQGFRFPPNVIGGLGLGNQ
jgi:hypothetical protein